MRCEACNRTIQHFMADANSVWLCRRCYAQMKRASIGDLCDSTVGVRYGHITTNVSPFTDMPYRIINPAIDMGRTVYPRRSDKG